MVLACLVLSTAWLDFGVSEVVTTIALYFFSPSPLHLSLLVSSGSLLLEFRIRPK